MFELSWLWTHGENTSLFWLQQLEIIWSYRVQTKPALALVEGCFRWAVCLQGFKWLKCKLSEICRYAISLQTCIINFFQYLTLLTTALLLNRFLWVYFLTFVCVAVCELLSMTASAATGHIGICIFAFQNLALRVLWIVLICKCPGYFSKVGRNANVSINSCCSHDCSACMRKRAM